VEQGKRKPIALEREQGYRFRVKFNRAGVADLITDEREPIGGGEGPSPGMLLQTAIANCLASSLLFCLEKARLEVKDLEAEVEAVTGRNEEGRMRIQRVRVRLMPTMGGGDVQKVGRCLDIFEAFCLVTESVRQGLPVDVDVAPRSAEATA
jgi:uncharacterized OsmC-like protein